MPRIRSIHYDALKSEKLAAASAEAERLYWRMATHCDDDGRAEDDPRIFAAYLFPLDDAITGTIVDGWLNELARLGLIVRYEVAGRRYVQVARWKDYQKPNKPTPSKYPPPTGHGTDDDGSATGALPLGVGVGVGVGEGELAPAERPRDLIFDALVEVCAIDASQLTSSARGALNKARKELVALEASDEDVRRKADAYRAAYPGISLTPSALVKHWPALGSPTTVKPSTYSTPTRALLGRGVGAAPTWELDDEGRAVPVAEVG